MRLNRLTPADFAPRHDDRRSNARSQKLDGTGFHETNTEAASYFRVVFNKGDIQMSNPNQNQKDQGQQNQTPGEKPGQQQGGGQKPGQQTQDPNRQGQTPDPGKGR